MKLGIRIIIFLLAFIGLVTISVFTFVSFYSSGKSEINEEQNRCINDGIVNQLDMYYFDENYYLLISHITGFQDKVIELIVLQHNYPFSFNSCLEWNKVILRKHIEELKLPNKILIKNEKIELFYPNEDEEKFRLANLPINWELEN